MAATGRMSAMLVSDDFEEERTDLKVGHYRKQKKTIATGIRKAQAVS